MKDVHAALNLDPDILDERVKFDNDALRTAIIHNPDAARKKHSFKLWRRVENVYPLFMAVSLHASADVVRTLCDIHPEALDYHDDDTCYVLHYGCMFQAPADVMQLLIHRCTKKTIGAKDRLGDSPLHIACWKKVPLEVIRLLMERCPKVCMEKDANGWMPLHMAYFRKVIPAPRENLPSFEMIKLLAEGYPPALVEKEEHGNTPLMLAKDSNASPEVLDFLTTLQRLHCDDIPDDELMELLLVQTATSTWRSRVVPILDARPSIVHSLDLDERVLPLLLSRMGRDCRLDAMFGIVQGLVGLFERIPMFTTRERKRSFCLLEG